MTRNLYRMVILSFLAFTACDQQMVYDQYFTAENGLWTWKDVAEFEIAISDTVSIHNMYIQVRHSVDYPMSNLYMFVVLKGPSGQFTRDTVNLELATPDGQWIGRGSGKLREIRYLLRKQFRFGEPGNYLVYVEQAMRRQGLPVRDVGIRVEKTNP